MALRLIQTAVPQDRLTGLQAVINAHPTHGEWLDERANGDVAAQILVDAQHTEAVLDDLNTRFSATEGFRAIVLPVQATIPLVGAVGSAPAEDPAEEPTVAQATARVSRYELHQEVSTGAQVTRVFIAMTALSSVVAAVGLMRDNVAVIIGAMVIAPLLGPNMALALATTLADKTLGAQALRANATGVAIGLAIAALLGSLLEVDPLTPEIAARTQVTLSDIVLALASGSAGALAFTAGLSSTVVGVMVAVALMPPLMTFGMLLAADHMTAAGGALLLLAVNVICVNLSAVLTFVAQGVRPSAWWEASRAKRANRTAIALWVCLLAVLAAIILYAKRG